MKLFVKNKISLFACFGAIILLLVSVVAPGYSQNITASESDIKNQDTLSLETIAANVDEFLNKQLNQSFPPKQIDDTVLVRMLFSTNYSINDQNEAYKTYYGKEKSKLNGDPGLKLTGSYIENFEPGVLDNEDLTYYRRFYVGIEWDLLSGGLVSNLKRAKILDKELEIKQLESSLDNKENNYLYIYNYLTYLFKRQKIEKLNQRHNVLKEQLKIAHQLYFLRYIQWEDILDLQSKLSEVEVMMNNNDVYYNRRLKNSFPDMMLDDSFLYNYLPILDLDANRMIDIFNRSVTANQMTTLKLDKIDLEYNRFSDWSLKPYVRFNYLALNNLKDRTYTSAGVNLSVPLKLKSHQGESRAARQKIMENNQEKERFGAGSELLNNYYEYQFKKMQYISFYFKLLLVEERLRKEIVKRDLGLESFSPLRAISVLDEKISIEIEMVDIKKDMYLKFLKIYSSLEEKNPNNFVRVMSPEELSRKYQGNRSLYIWSSEFKDMPLSTMLAYLKNTEIKDVLLSVGINRTPEFDQKVEDFVFQAKAININTHLLIGTKRVDSASAVEFISQKTEIARRFGMKSIHLDVEMHTIDDFKINSDIYEKEYIYMLRTARNQCDANGLQLSVSIPVYYNKTLLDSIYNLCDKVYLMAYEHPDIEYITQKVTEEFEVNAAKTIVAISASDFKDRLLFEAFVRKLLEKLGADQLAIHDLGRLIELDNRSVSK